MHLPTGIPHGSTSQRHFDANQDAQAIIQSYPHPDPGAASNTYLDGHLHAYRGTDSRSHGHPNLDPGPADSYGATASPHPDPGPPQPDSRAKVGFHVPGR